MRGLGRSEDFSHLGVVQAGTSGIPPVGVGGVVGFLVEKQVLVGAEPELEAAVLVELVVELLAFLGSVGLCVALGKVVVEATECLSAKLEDVGVCRLVAGLGGGVELLLLHRKSEVGRALEDGELGNVGGDLLNRLDARGTSTDDTDTLALDIDALLRPDGRVGANALELVEALERGNVALGGKAGAEDEVLGLVDVTTLGVDVPDARGVVPLGGLDVGVEAVVR
jgi:hypothetical protein